MQERYEKDGKVAVLYSPGYGAGWSSWAHEHEDALLFHPEIVQAVLDGDRKKAKDIAESLCGDSFYGGGAEDLEIEWLPKGTQFEVDEYDGFESIRILQNFEWHVA